MATASFFFFVCARCHGDRNTNIQLVAMATLYFLHSTCSSSQLSIKDAQESIEAIKVSSDTHRDADWSPAGHVTAPFQFQFS
jgi:hypothetical protein